jgi:aryl-alcohol dehydrogenase-like predicted oxidoreductase
MVTKPNLHIDLAGRDMYRLGFGTATHGSSPAPTWRKYRQQSLDVIREAVERGVQFIDTADSYGEGVSEELIAEALYPYPANVMVATKGGYVMEPKPWTPDGRPERIKRICDGSLTRLRVERIGLYQLHAPDPSIPFEDTVGAFVELRDAGKIAHIGLSNVSEEQLTRAIELTPVASVQNRYNLEDRSSEAVLDLCVTHGIAFIPWSPTKTGPHAALDAVAAELDATARQVALAWLLHHSPVILPIPGTSSIAHLQENMASANLGLSDDQMLQLAEGRA